MAPSCKSLEVSLSEMYLDVSIAPILKGVRRRDQDPCSYGRPTSEEKPPYNPSFIVSP